MRALRLLAQRPGSFVVHGLLAGLALPLVFCLIGIPVVIGILVSLAGLSLEVAWQARATRAAEAASRGRWTAGVAIATALGSLALAAAAALELAGSGATASHAGAAARLAAVVAPLVLAACLSPLLFVPFAALDEGAGLAESALRSAHVAARRGAPRQLATAVLATAWLVAPFAIVGFVPWRSLDPSPWLFYAALGVFLLSAFAAAPGAFVTVADAYVSSDPRAPIPARGARTSALRTGRLLLACVLGLGAALAVTLTVAALRPLPLLPGGPGRAGPPPGDPVAGRRGSHAPIPRTRLPGTRVTVRGAHDGIVVEADDGGGVGHVRYRQGSTPDTLWIVPLAGDTFELVVSDGSASGARHAVVDARGVRTDDDVGRRWAERVGTAGALLLSTVALLWLLALWRVGARLAAARNLGHPLGAAAHPATLGALEGKLWLDDGATVWVEPARWPFGRGCADVRGAARLETLEGQVRVRIAPGRVPALSAEGTARSLSAGEPLTLVGRFGRLGAQLRETEAGWPRDGLLVPGGHERAASALASDAMRSWAAIAAALMVLEAATTLVLVLRF